MPLISIIIPIYNAQKTLTQCLKSIFDQTNQRFEIIAVNDGSTDASRDILQQFSNQITIINQPNQGAPKARNVGAAAAQGCYLLFCDADIILMPNALAQMLEALEKNQNASYAYSAFRFGKKFFKLWPFDSEKLKKMPYIHTTSLIRKEHFPGFDTTLQRFQDWDIWLTMLKRGYVGVYIPELLFTVKTGGTMSQWLPKIAYQLPFLKQVKAYHRAEKIIRQKHNLL